MSANTAARFRSNSSNVGENRRGKEDVDEEVELECDESVYVMLHHAKTVAPCLSFDVVKDKLGDDRIRLPHTLYLVSGTQAARANANSVVVMRMSNLCSTQKIKPGNDGGYEDDDDSSSEEDEELIRSKLPKLNAALIKHNGGCNRVRCMRGGSHVVSTWSDTGRVHIWDTSPALDAVDDERRLNEYIHNSSSHQPVYTFTGHMREGFALDWSPTQTGRLLSGDCGGSIHLWQPVDTSMSGWQVDQRPYSGHTGSVEDLQWSPDEDSVFASCSVDTSIRVWDCRAAPSKACMLTRVAAHQTDVNVIHWNLHEPFILSGGDDACVKVWDLRQFQGEACEPVATFKYHSGSITSCEWHPTDSSVFGVSGSDDRVTQWDLAVEECDPAGHSSGQTGHTSEGQEVSVPPQLLFIHQGQRDVKEIHWHPQIPGLMITTASDGINVFKTISV